MFILIINTYQIDKRCIGWLFVKISWYVPFKL